MDRDQMPAGLGPSPLTSPTRMPTVAASEAEAVTPAKEAGTEALGATGGTGVVTAETRPPGAAPGNSPPLDTTADKTGGGGVEEFNK